MITYNSFVPSLLIRGKNVYKTSKQTQNKRRVGLGKLSICSCCMNVCIEITTLGGVRCKCGTGVIPTYPLYENKICSGDGKRRVFWIILVEWILSVSRFGYAIFYQSVFCVAVFPKLSKSPMLYAVFVSDVVYMRGLCFQKQGSRAGISNLIPQFYVGCNFFPLPEIPASAAKVEENHISKMRPE